MTASVAGAVAGELAALAASVPEPVRQCAARLAARGGTGVVGVLFYGSILRGGELGGVLDFYVIVDRLADWGIGPVIAAACRVLPPFVEYVEIETGGQILRAKVAVLTRDQFSTLVRPPVLNTTVWARFSQPSALVWSRDEAGRQALEQIVAQAVTTACGWAYALGPQQAGAGDFWRSLFRHTYRVELRVERHDGRAADIVAAGGERYERLLPLAWADLDLPFTGTAGSLRRMGTAPSPFRGWWRQRLAGKPLNLARLAKAAFTFKGGPAYLAWKIERHSGVALNLTPWQQRHPILSAPALLWRLWRGGVIR